MSPEGEGWFVLNAREAAWWRSDELGQATTFEGELRDSPSSASTLRCCCRASRTACITASRSRRTSSSCTASASVILDGEERRLRAWDFVHCPAMSEHVFVGAGDGPCGHRDDRPTEGRASRSVTRSMTSRRSTARASSKRRRTRRKPTRASPAASGTGIPGRMAAVSDDTAFVRQRA